MKILRNRIAPLATLALLLAAAPALAGIRYTAVTSAEGQGAEMQRSTVKALVDGDKARIEFAESGNPMMGKGTYMLTTDGGQTLLLVNPEEKTFSKWDLDAMMNTAGTALKAMGGLVKMSFSDPKVEKLLEEAGPSIQGLPTTHSRFRTSYTMSMSVFGRKSSNTTVTEEDLWTTTALDDAALSAWLRKGPPKTGHDELDKLVAAEMGKTSGFPLKRVMKSTATDEKGKAQTSTTTMEVTELDRNAVVPPGAFVLPAGYKEQPLFPTAMAE